MRKTVLILCLLIALWSAGAHAAVCFCTDAGAALLTREGDEIIPFGQYDSFVSLGNDLYAAYAGDTCALMGADGQSRTDCVYNELKAADGAHILCRIGIDWGILRADGNVLFDCDYAAITPAGCDTFFAISGSAYDIRSDRLYLLYTDGTSIETDLSIIDMGTTAEGGLLRVLLPDENMYGYCDARGNMAIPAQYAYADEFCGGIAAVTADDKCAVINTRGEYILSPEYDRIEIGSAGILAIAGNEILLADLSGAEYLRTTGNSAWLAGAYCAVAREDGVTIYSARGERIADLGAYAAVSALNSDSILISDGLWGENCVYILGTDAKYQNIYPLGDSVCAFLRANAVRFKNDLLGEIQYSVDAASMHYGIIDLSGNILLDAIYTELSFAEDDRFIARTEAQWQMIDSAGNIYYARDIPTDEAASFE